MEKVIVNKCFYRCREFYVYREGLIRLGWSSFEREGIVELDIGLNVLAILCRLYILAVKECLLVFRAFCLVEL